MGRFKCKQIFQVVIALMFVLVAFSPIATYSAYTPLPAHILHTLDMQILNSSAVPSTNEKNNFYVNPEEPYKNEPAPVGLADYGLGPHNTAYRYNTTSFLGSAKIYNIAVVNNTTGNKCMTFQLNINLVFNNNNQKYVYWAQDVALFNTSAKEITFIDNIWNMSSVDANMYNSTVSGNGTVGNSSGTHYYYACASDSLPGNDRKLTYPASISFMVNSTVKTGMPELNFMYNDGYGWVTYDDPVFHFATNLTSDSGFVVDGYNYEPDKYSFYDAELILGGPGNGSCTVDTASNIHLSIQYWNGHNYQEITNAFNYGSDTAETISNVTSNSYYYISNGTLFENVTAGNGSLRRVYTSRDISILNVSTPFSGGTIYVNVTGHSFAGKDVNLTLASGEYNLSIYNCNRLYKNLTVNLKPGEYLPLDIAPKYNVNFTETGLASGTTWSVTINGHTESSSTDTILFALANNTYRYYAGDVNGNKIANGSGIVIVHGKNITVGNIKYTPDPNYTIYYLIGGLIVIIAIISTALIKRKR